MRFIREKTVVQLTYLPNVFPVNCYLVEEEEGLTLVDAALPNNVKAILQAADQVGKPITRIVLTHAHDDHIGALDGLKKLLPAAKVFISSRDARLLGDDRSLDPNESDVPIRGDVPSRVRTKPAMATWDKQTSLETARRLRDLNPALLATGHGNMVTEPKQVMEKAIAEAERSLAK